MSLPTPHDERPYTVTECPDCRAHTALVVFPETYVCVICGGTGTYTPGGWLNAPHLEPDEDARDAFKKLHEERHSMRVYMRACKRHMAERIHAV